MTDRLPHLEMIFPNLAAAGYNPKSDQSTVYNCIAYAVGDETKKWAGYRKAGYYWPDGAVEGYALDALISAYEQIGFANCESDVLEPEYEKVALYVDSDGLWTHAAKQCDDGQWTSKLGNLEDIIHRTLQAVAGPDPAYGQLACFMKRRREPDTEAKEAAPQEDLLSG